VYIVLHETRSSHKSSFWSHQPVTWESNEAGPNEFNSKSITAIDAPEHASPMLVTISKLPLFNLSIPEEMRFHVYTDKQMETNTQYETIYSFLRENFSSYLRIKEEVLAHHITLEKAVNIGLYHGKDLVGFIHGRPIQIVFHGNMYDIYYVEYLCVHDDYRNRNIASLLISRYIQEMERITGRDDLWFLFKKDGQKHPFVSFFQSNYQYIELDTCKSGHALVEKAESSTVSQLGIAITDEETKRMVYNRWVEYSSSFHFHRKMSYEEFATPVTHIWICGVDNIALVGKSSELYDPVRDTHNAVIDIEYVIPLHRDLSSHNKMTETVTDDTSDENDVTVTTDANGLENDTDDVDTNTNDMVSLYPWSFSDLVTHLKQEGYVYITVNRIGFHEEILRSVEPTFQWKIANQFQYYAYNFKCPKLDTNEFYFTIN
jgi:GNAT superfamily N-acetyltransferase